MSGLIAHPHAAALLGHEPPSEVVLARKAQNIVARRGGGPPAPCSRRYGHRGNSTIAAVAQLDSSPLDPLGRAPSGALVVVAIASVQFGSAVATQLFGAVGPAGAVLLRLLFSSFVLLAIWRPPVRSRSRRELLLVAVFGLVLAGMNLSFYEALHRIPLGVAVTIEFVGPLAVAVGGSRRRLDLLWVVLAAAGILALARGGTHGLSALGVAFALIAGCLWAAYILVNARVGQAFERGTGLALALAIGSIGLLPFGIVAGGSHLLEPRSLGLGLAVAMLSSAIPYSCELEALRRIRTSVFGVLMSLEPAMAAFAGFLVLGQGLSARSLVGIALVVAASVGAARHSSKAPVAL
jgi:inner membrane transporter RhtA